MSYRIETLNKGQVERFGFLFGNVFQVGLGEIPPISLRQFCAYATDTLIGVLEQMSPSERKNIANKIYSTVYRIAEQKVRPEDSFPEIPHSSPAQVNSSQVLPRQNNMDIKIVETSGVSHLIDAIKDARRKGQETEEARISEELLLFVLSAEGDNKPHDYQENPFRLEDTHIAIGDMYKVDIREFTIFALSVMKGGISGWDAQGIPEFAHTSLKRLSEVATASL